MRSTEPRLERGMIVHKLRFLQINKRDWRGRIWGGKPLRLGRLDAHDDIGIGNQASVAEIAGRWANRGIHIRALKRGVRVNDKEIAIRTWKDVDPDAKLEFPGSEGVWRYRVGPPPRH